MYIDQSFGFTGAQLEMYRIAFVSFWISSLNFVELCYSIPFILFDANIDVSRHILVVDTSILASNNMDWRE
jgi:hypothetical protein